MFLRVPKPVVLAAVAGSLALATSAIAGPTFNLVFHSNLDEHNGDPGGGGIGPFHYNDIWGYTTPAGDDYVLLGLYDGVAVINVVDPYEPYETAYFPDIGSSWRDIKTYQHYAYVTNESGGGLMILDLTDPENPVRLPNYTGFSTAHNLFIDTSTGRAYIAGSNLSAGGVRILSLTANPTSPVPAGSWENAYFHDVMVQNGRLYGSAIYVGALYVLDVSNPLSPSFLQTLGTASGYPNAFTHNAWVTEDDAYVMTTDENSPGRCRMWDLSTLPNLVEVDSYKPNAVTIPHNTHIEGDYAYISFYELGLKVVDVSDPANLVEVAAIDTWPSGDGSEYHGNWGVYPFFGTQTNLLAVSDGATGLYLVSWVGPLGTVAGTVTESGSGTPVDGARVEFVASGYRATTAADGSYTVQDVAGPHDVTISAFGYESQTTSVSVTEGGTTPLNVALVPLPRANLGGEVVSVSSGLGIAGAVVEIDGTPLSAVTDVAGIYSIPSVPQGPWTVRATAFGMTPAQASISIAGGIDGTQDFPLNPAIVAADMETSPAGWSVGGSVTSGAWERADPQGTSSSGIPVQPEDDHTPGGTLCWVTGAAAGGSLGGNDVDGGATTLTTSTYALAGTSDPHVSYWRWYSTGIGNASVDAWRAEVSSNGGSSWVDIENTYQTSNAWVRIDVPLNSLITPTNLVRFRFTAQDTGAGSITEAALDDFMIYDGFDEITETSVPVLPVDSAWQLGRVHPNPIRSGVVAAVDLALPHSGRIEATVHDVSGRRVATLASRPFDAGRHRLRWDGSGPDGPLPSGVYFLRVKTADVVRSRKVLIVR
ncbi:MAG: choice-of-anchor B family protein [Gemmatimonadetes bacterium]|nr:choice-of-anchor B family protein [Gemmatimonadota bacterium]